MENKKRKTVKCTDCSQDVFLDEMIISSDDWEGCTYYGHIVTKQHLNELKIKL